MTTKTSTFTSVALAVVLVSGFAYSAAALAQARSASFILPCFLYASPMRRFASTTSSDCAGVLENLVTNSLSARICPFQSSCFS